MMGPNRRLLDLFAIALPILQAPMAGSWGTALALAVVAAGSGDFSGPWADQAATLAPEVPAGALKRKFASDAAALTA